MSLKINDCVECGSQFYTSSSHIDSICPECAHHLYGFANCNHQFQNGRCIACFWDGHSSEYIKKLKEMHR